MNNYLFTVHKNRYPLNMSKYIHYIDGKKKHSNNKIMLSHNNETTHYL